MPNVKIRIENVNNEQLESQKQGQEVAGKVTAEKLAVASIFAHQAINTGKQIVSASISNIGNFTGDYVKQDNVQRNIDLLLNIGSVAVQMFVNPVMAVATMTGLAIKEIVELDRTIKLDQKAERTANLMRERAGYSTTNGSRTGE